jgi:hypothetical protein
MRDDELCLLLLKSIIFILHRPMRAMQSTFPFMYHPCLSLKPILSHLLLQIQSNS